MANEDEPCSYSYVIRTPEAEARAARRTWIKRAAVAVALIGALMAPGTVDAVAPHDCAQIWVC